MKKPGQPGRPFQIRFRCQGDAENFAKLLRVPADRIVETPRGDYGWRIFLAGDELTALLVVLAESVDYPNFKSQIGQGDQADKLPAYGDFWTALLDYQQRKATSSRRG